MGRVKQKSAFEHAHNVWIHVILHMPNVSSVHLLSMKQSKDSDCRQRMSWLDCADAQADLGPRCPHMPEDTFSHIFISNAVKVQSYKLDIIKIKYRLNLYIVVEWFLSSDSKTSDKEKQFAVWQMYSLGFDLYMEENKARLQSRSPCRVSVWNVHLEMINDQ